MPKEILTSKYITFWIPNVAHNDFQIIEEIVSRENIPGNNGSHYNLKSDITKNHKTNTFSVRLMIDEVTAKQVKTQYTVILESIDSCVSGLLEFKYDLNNHYHNKFQKVVHHVYRLVVQHFHRHIYHDPHNEGVLQAYCSDKKCPLDVEDNDALYFYLTKIHKLVSAQVEMIHDMVPKIALEDKEEPASQEEINKNRRDMEIFYKKCENLRGQMPFFHSLINSPANKSCHVLSVKATNAKEKELHAIAHNIVNLSKSIINLFEKSKTAFYIKNINTSYDIQSNIKSIAQDIKETAKENKKIIKKVDEATESSTRTNIISIVLAVISVLLGGWSINLALRDAKSENSDVNQAINSLQISTAPLDSLPENPKPENDK